MRRERWLRFPSLPHRVALAALAVILLMGDARNGCAQRAVCRDVCDHLDACRAAEGEAPRDRRDCMDWCTTVLKPGPAYSDCLIEMNDCDLYDMEGCGVLGHTQGGSCGAAGSTGDGGG